MPRNNRNSKMTRTGSPKSGCWTCRNRRVACDRATPACGSCSKSGRVCKGYSLRLSWPRPDDEKRSLVHCIDGRSLRGPAAFQWVNTSFQDLEMHHLAASLSTYDDQQRTLLQLSIPEQPYLTLYSVSSPAGDLEEDLFAYFQREVVPNLPVFDSDRQELGRILVDLASMSTIGASKAVELSILALASLFRNGDNSQTARYKFGALNALMFCLEEGVNRMSSIMHIAAGVLLCVFEMHRVPLYDSQWVSHICCAQGVASVLEIEDFSPTSDEAKVLGWALYFDVLSRFSFRHWRTPAIKAIAKELGFNPEGNKTCATQFVLARNSFGRRLPNFCQYGHPILGLLSEVLATPMLSSDPRYHSEEYQAYKAGLAQRLKDLPLEDLSSATSQQVRLLRVATLIYFTRTSTNFSGQSTSIDNWTHEGLNLMASSTNSHWPFPLFILACEASTDEHRLQIMKTFEINFNLDKVYHLHLQTIKTMVQAAWAQEDLATAGQLEYIRKLNLVMSSSIAVPIFA